MNINKVGIDTMGKADDPAIDKDIEREAYYEAKIKEIPESVSFMKILQACYFVIELDEELYDVEDALCLIEENGSAEPLRLIIEASVAQMALKLTQQKYGN